MAWKRQSTSISVDADVGLDEFDREQLLQALIDDQCITEAEAEMLSKRTSPIGTMTKEESDDLYLARHHLRRGDKIEAFHHIENYLGREWHGLLTQ